MPSSPSVRVVATTYWPSRSPKLSEVRFWPIGVAGVVAGVAGGAVDVGECAVDLVGGLRVLEPGDGLAVFAATPV